MCRGHGGKTRQQMEQDASLEDDGNEKDGDNRPFEELGIHRLLVEERYKAKRQKGRTHYENV